GSRQELRPGRSGCYACKLLLCKEALDNGPMGRRAYCAFVSKIAVKMSKPPLGVLTGSCRLLFSAHHQFRDSGQLHVRRAFVDFADLGVAPVLLDRIVLGETIPPV